MLEVARRLGPCCDRSPSFLAAFGLLLTVQAALTVQVAWAQSSLDRFYPPIVQRGIETMIAVEGKLDPWPQTVVCDRDDVTVVCDEEAGRCEQQEVSDCRHGTW